MSNDITVTLPAASTSSLINNSRIVNKISTKNTVVVSSVVVIPSSSSPTSSAQSITTIAIGGGICNAAAGLNAAINNDSNTNNKSGITTDIEKPSKTGSDDCNKESPTPKFGSRRNSSKTRHCTSLPIFHNASELCEIGSQPGMECMPLRTPPGPYHYHHVTDQTKSLQELQNEVGALLEFRDLVIETFPDLKHKMASMSTTNTLTGMASSSLASRREWEPGIRVKRKITPKENSEMVSSSLIRSRSNSHSGKKEPKSGEGNGSVVQDSGFSTETSSSKEAHSASSTTGAMQGTVATNRLPADADDDDLLNLLDVIHRKSNRLREEVEYLQNLEKNTFSNKNSSSNNSSDNNSNCLQKTFQEHVEKLNREDFQLLRKERDRLLDKLAEMEAETLTGRIKATNLQDQVEELSNVKKELEEKLKLALSQKLELMHELQRQYNSSSNASASTSKSSPSQSESTATNYRNSTAFLSESATTQSHFDGVSSRLVASTAPITTASTVASNNIATSTINTTSTTFQPVVVESSADDQNLHKNLYPFHSNNNSSDISSQRQSRDDLLKNLGRLDGLISSPNRTVKVRMTDSKKFAAILLETNVLELQRHLLTLTVQNQILSQRLEQATKSKIHLLKRLDKSKEELDDIRFQLEEKDIELEGTKAQLRVLESKTSLKLDFNTTTTNETNRSSSTMILSSSRESPITTPTQISTPSMKAMIPLAMEEIQQHSSSTESAQDQTERTDSRLGSSSGHPETPKRSRPSKIPLPGTKGYLAPKPPTGRSPVSSSSVAITSHQKSPSTNYGPVSNKSLSRSTGNLYGKSGPPSIKRFNEMSSSFHRPESAQSNTKDNSLTGGLNTSSRSSSSSIPISSKSTPSPNKMISNSPLPRPKRDSLTSRVRHLDSLSRVHNLCSSTSTSTTVASSTAATTIKSTMSPSSTPSSPSNNHNNSNNSSNNLNNLTSSTNSFNNNNNNQNNCTTTINTSNLLFRSTSTSTSNSKKDISSSFSQGQLRDRDRSSKLQNAISVRRVSSASIGRGSTVDLHQQQQHHHQQHHQQQQNENESGKMNKIKKFESLDSLIIDNENFKRNEQHQQQQYCMLQSQQQQQRQQQNFNSRNLIQEYIAKTYIPPPIFKIPPYYHGSCQNFNDDDNDDNDDDDNKAQIDLAYKHPQLFFDLDMNDHHLPSEENAHYLSDNDDDDNDDTGRSLNSNISTVTTATTTTTSTKNYQTNKGIEIKYFKHSQDHIAYPESIFLRRTVSASNFHVKNHCLPPPYTRTIAWFENSEERLNSASSPPRPQSSSQCKLIGKVNPFIAKTWEQLNAFQLNNGSNRNLSRSVSNMSDDSEKLFFCHPMVQESKSNFHVNKVIYSKEKQAIGNEEEDESKDGNDEGRRKREGDYEESESDEEISGNFYDSIDDDDDDDDNCNFNRGDINNESDTMRVQQQQQQQQQHCQYIYSIDYQHCEEHQDDDAGEEMAEIDSFEKKKYSWSLEN